MVEVITYEFCFIILFQAREKERERELSSATVVHYHQLTENMRAKGMSRRNNLFCIKNKLMKHGDVFELLDILHSTQHSK